MGNVLEASSPPSSASSSSRSQLHASPLALSASSSSAAVTSAQPSTSRRAEEFEKLLGAKEIDLTRLRKLAWTGVPKEYRAKVWQLLLGYSPTKTSRRDETLRLKREDYVNSLPKYWGQTPGSASGTPPEMLEEDQKNLRQILVDIPRTAPDLPLFHSDEVRKSMERILYLYAIRHPASGYVQGMNDLLTPLYCVFLADCVTCGDLTLVNTVDTSRLGPGLLEAVEADTHYCLTKLLDGIQDHYTSSQPGLQRMVYLLSVVVQRIDAPLAAHFEKYELMFVQFAFRWMNCLLLRELSLPFVCRLWDTMLSEESGGFTSFHVYVCAALLVSFSEDLREMNLEEMIIFLQALPTSGWSEERAESLLSQAFILQTLFEQSPAHLGTISKPTGIASAS